jgi:hypothetical protein
MKRRKAMTPVPYTKYFNTLSTGISLLLPSNILLRVSPLIEALPPELYTSLLNRVLGDFYAVRNSPGRPQFRYVDIGGGQQASWRTSLFGPFFLLSPEHPPREVIVPVVSVSLAIEDEE